MSRFDDVYVVSQDKSLDQCVYISNFGINQSELTSGHRAALDRYVVPILESGGSSTILGMASRTGTYDHNLALSRSRAKTVYNYLRQNSRAKEKQFYLTIGAGEIVAALKQVADETESPLDRAVGINVSSKNTPPPPPPPPPRKVEARKYQCVGGRLDKDFYDRFNNAKHWLVKGASGSELSLHRFIKHAEEEFKHNGYSSYRDSSSTSLLQYYKSSEFRAWYINGLCGLERMSNVKYAMRLLASFNTNEGLSRKGMHQRMAGQFFKP